MDRPIVYAGQVPADTDALTGWMATMRAVSSVLYATLGTPTYFDGLAVSPGSGLTVSVGPGSITAHVVADTAAYGSLGTAANSLMKQGINPAAMTLGPFIAPTTVGLSVNILIQAAFSETDTNPALLPYMNAANPSVPYGGPGNNGVSQPTLRQQSVALSYAAGTPAATGSQTTPAATPGNVPIAVVTIGYGQASISSANISVPGNAPIIPWKLPLLTPGFSRMQVFTSSGPFTVPNGVTQAKVTVTGGGAGGGNGGSSNAGGGGGAGGVASGIVTGLVPGATVPVTVSPSAAAASNGGTSSFGSYLSATGGSAGASANSGPNAAGGAGGVGVGGLVNYGGSYGTDSSTVANSGGDGGGPGAGRGVSGAQDGINAPGYGAGGGGAGLGGSTTGGIGGSGLVVVEY